MMPEERLEPRLEVLGRGFGESRPEARHPAVLVVPSVGSEGEDRKETEDTDAERPKDRGGGLVGRTSFFKAEAEKGGEDRKPREGGGREFEVEVCEVLEEEGEQSDRGSLFEKTAKFSKGVPKKKKEDREKQKSGRESPIDQGLDEETFSVGGGVAALGGVGLVRKAVPRHRHRAATDPGERVSFEQRC